MHEIDEPGRAAGTQRNTDKAEDAMSPSSLPCAVEAHVVVRIGS